MAPNTEGSKSIYQTRQIKKETIEENELSKPKEVYKFTFVWRNIIGFIYIHLGALYGISLIPSAMTYTIIWMFTLALTSGLGITAGAHRLFAHKSYKAKWPLKFMLILFNTIAFQNHLYEWVRDHRLHHKHTETNADPHNAQRGFFFSHMGWLCVKKHPDVKEKGKTIDMSDLESDPMIRFQRKYYPVLMPVCNFLLPTIIPVYLWGESWKIAFYVCAIFRWCYILNVTWLVNSAAHLWGNKPYDKNISPSESRIANWGTWGEGWHNYHHTYPWDYKASELPSPKIIIPNLTTPFINLMARIGWAYDLKTVPSEVVIRRALRTGDGSHDAHLYGWTDKSMTDDDRKDTLILNQSQRVNVM